MNLSQEAIKEQSRPQTPFRILGEERGRQMGGWMIVCGCGQSLHLASGLGGLTTIGVNDIGRLFDPTYLVVVNPPKQFRNDRFSHVRRSRAKALFTQLDLGPVDPPVVRFKLGRYGGTEIGVGDEPVLHFTQNSPYVAVCLAAWMGAKRIGLIGVDFTDHHFFAPTGRHPLAGRLAQIDREYGALAQALAGRGVELVNLSPVSRLQSLARVRIEDFVAASPIADSALRLPLPPLPAVAAPKAGPAEATLATIQPRASTPKRLFIVNYRFVTCGDVFADGLRHAAVALGLDQDEASWDDPLLPDRIARFRPDLVLVVHGRRFAERWAGKIGAWKTAVWLVDEPYEVDDTASWSGRFDFVFINDLATRARHRDAQVLPMAFDPEVHRDIGAVRCHRVGFIGGANPTRERFLLRLAEAGLLGYLVGGPWRSPALRALTLAARLPHGETARLYQQTEIVVNVFRDRHHFNAGQIAATAMNPRIYEALACGALVVSERRAEVGERFPALPQFDDPEALLAIVTTLLADRAELDRLRRDCVARLVGHAYQDRLATALRRVLGDRIPAVAGSGSAPESEVPSPLAPGPARHPEPARDAAELVAPLIRVQTEAPAPALAVKTRPEPLVPGKSTTSARRHLLYHLWPVRGGNWRWNVDQLLARIDLFNGRRLIAIVTDDRTDSAETVRAAFAGHGCEFIEMPNDERGESASFPKLLESVADEAGDDLVFYAHAKGVKYEPTFPPAVRRWAEVQYQVMLDHWPSVRDDLDRFAMTGALRRLGRFANHQRLGDWHYCGTFFWFRHASVFSRRWHDVPAFYGGVEAWPGVIFSRAETGCLLLDNLRDLPYHERFWSQRGDPALARWRRQCRGVDVPPDLADPAPFEGYRSPRLEQKPDEFAWWLQRLLASDARRLLVIGSPCGGVEWHVARTFAQQGRPIAITTLHAGNAPALDHALADAAVSFRAQVDRVDSSSADPAIGARLQGPFDAAFIDGEHGFAACRRDVDLAFALGARQVALHDIVDSTWHAQAHCCVSRVWADLHRSHDTEACQGADWGGIGLVHRRQAG